MAIIKGKQLMVFVGGKSIGYATSHTLDLSANTTETSHKDISGLGTSAIVVNTSWTMSTENLYSTDSTHGNTFSDLFSAWESGVTVDVVMGGRGGTPVASASEDGSDQPASGWTPVAPQYVGKALITSLSLSAPDGDNASFSATFTGVGKLVETTT